MFLLDHAAPNFREDPRPSFEARSQALARRPTRVLYFYDLPDSSTFRYRVHNMIQVLRDSMPEVAASWFCRDDLDRMDEVLPGIAVLVLCRVRYSAAIAQMVVRARAQGTRVLFDVDDFVFDARHANLIVETLAQPHTEGIWDYWFGYIGRIGGTLRLCDGVIATNDYLADRVRGFCDLPCRVIPNFLNEEQLAVSDPIRAAKARSGYARDGIIHIGYFSGSPTHLYDFAIAEAAIDRIMAEDARIRLRLVGYIASGSRLSKYGDRIDIFPMQDYRALQHLIATTEINMVPLQDNLFTNAKSELKIFEASAVATISVASRSFTLTRAIEDRVTGFLASPHEWEATLREAVATLDNGAYPAMADRAAQRALDRFSPSRQAAAVRAALFPDGPGDHDPAVPPKP